MDVSSKTSVNTLAVVTSCSAAGWEQYGRRFAGSFARYWPPKIALHLVSEDMHAWSEGTMVFHSLWGESAAAHEFHERHLGHLRAHGKERCDADFGWTPKKIAAGYNFRLDAYRFAKKVFAIQIAAGMAGSGRLFWVDADVVTFAPVPLEMLERLLPDEVALSCLDRGDGYHPECGFVGYNLDHPVTRGFIAELARLYASDEVFALREWHDSWVWQWLRKRMAIPTHHIPHCSRQQPFANSELSKCMDHCKGNNKNPGRTPKQSRMIKDGNPYWT